MTRHLAVVTLFVAATGCFPAGRGSPRLGAWPDNPCAVLTGEQVTAATRLTVTNVRRAPSIGKVVQAPHTGGDPGPGKYICVYETRSDYVDLYVIAPTPEQSSSVGYWASREQYFRQFPGSARAIANLGEDAWIAGGTTLHVLARHDLHFVVATRMYQEGSDRVLIALARAVLARV